VTDAGSYPVTYSGYYDAECRPVRGVVPVEEAITLNINGRPLLRLMCTPIQLEELALGFLFNERLIEGLDEVNEIKMLDLPDGRRWIDVWLDHEMEESKLRTITSGCSGGATFEDIGDVHLKLKSDLRVTPQQVAHLMQELSRSAVLYKRTGGIHVAALADGERLVCVAEDVGRHNALDKIVGICLRRYQTAKDHILLNSGRISSEMVGKALRMGVPIVISRTSPTSLSIQVARACSITLIGYTRRRSFRVYSGEERVAAPECS